MEKAVTNSSDLIDLMGTLSDTDHISIITGNLLNKNSKIKDFQK